MSLTPVSSLIFKTVTRSSRRRRSYTLRAPDSGPTDVLTPRHKPRRGFLGESRFARCARRVQPHLFPSLSAIERFVRSVAPGRALPVVGLTRSTHTTDGSDGAIAMFTIVETTFLIGISVPTCAVIGCLPNAPRSRTHVNDVRIALTTAKSSMRRHRRGPISRNSRFLNLSGDSADRRAPPAHSSPTRQVMPTNQNHPEAFHVLFIPFPLCARPGNVTPAGRITQQVF